MSVQAEILEAVGRICAERGAWWFVPEEVVRALPHLNPSTVRTHIVSRCCVNAPANHAHRLAYFRRVRRGEYQLLPKHRPPARTARTVTSRTCASSSTTRTVSVPEERPFGRGVGVSARIENEEERQRLREAVQSVSNVGDVGGYIVRTAAENVPEHKLLEKLRFLHEGVLRKARFAGGAWHDLHLYAILEDEWQALHWDQLSF